VLNRQVVILDLNVPDVIAPPSSNPPLTIGGGSNA